MNILVNGTPLLAPLTGVGQYIRHLFTAMDQLPDAEVHLYYGTRCERGVALPSPATAQAVQRSYGVIRRVIPRPRAVRKLAERAMFAYFTRRLSGVAIYHEPNFVPLPHAGPLVLTVHDLSCFDHPDTHPLERVRLMHRDMPKAVATADHIVVVSDASGAALQRWFGVESARITTTHLAADGRFQPRDSGVLAPGLAGLGLTPGNYVLSVGTLEPRKNLGALFAAYAGLPQGLRQRFPLAVAGMSGWKIGELMQAAQGLLQSGELRLLGYVEDALIPALYAGAAVFCYPSRYEGFGLPALEAMASGVPVITSNCTSLPEVVGDAGLVVHPGDVDGPRDALRELLEDRGFA
ncbi:MAG: glycosyltransferase family 4 protein, partial [Rhodoferax sp.]|nr:glycosyltransferase family 4 protein [Rhodoferax sp.]